MSGLTESVIEALMRYAWPGNIRELENIIERGGILASDAGSIDVMHLFTSGEKIYRDPENAEKTGLTAADTATPTLAEQLPALLRASLANGEISMDALEGLAVDVAVDLAKGNVSTAAKILGTTRARVAYRLSGRKEPHPPEQDG